MDGNSIPKIGYHYFWPGLIARPKNTLPILLHWEFCRDFKHSISSNLGILCQPSLFLPFVEFCWDFEHSTFSNLGILCQPSLFLLSGEFCANPLHFSCVGNFTGNYMSWINKQFSGRWISLGCSTIHFFTLCWAVFSFINHCHKILYLEDTLSSEIFRLLKGVHFIFLKAHLLFSFFPWNPPSIFLQYLPNTLLPWPIWH